MLIKMTTLSAEEIGARILRMRKIRRFTQRELADRLDTHQSMVARWEKGQIYPREEIVQRIAEIFEVSVDELLSKDSGPTARSNSIDPELESLWNEVVNLSPHDRDVLKSVLEAMLVRSRVQEVVNLGGKRAS